MTSSSPSPSRALHQHANTDGDQDEGPESPEPIEVEPAKLLQQEDHAQTDQDKRSHRHARTVRCRLFVGTAALPPALLRQLPRPCWQAGWRFRTGSGYSSRTDREDARPSASPWRSGTPRSACTARRPRCRCRTCRSRGRLPRSGVAKISTWINPLAYSPLYMAPTPGMNPRIAASPGLLPLTGGGTPGATAPGPGGGGMVPLTCEARHSSQ